MRKKVFLYPLLFLLTALFFAGNVMAAPIPIDTYNLNILQEEFDNRTKGGISSINVYTDYDQNPSYWKIDASLGTVSRINFGFGAIFESQDMSFGIYQFGDKDKNLEIFSNTSMEPNAVSTVYMTPIYEDDNLTNFNFSLSSPAEGVSFDNEFFGYYLDIKSNPFGNYRLYSDSLLNNGYWHMLAYRGKNDEWTNNPDVNDPYYATFTPNHYLLAWEDLKPDSSDWDFNDFVVMVESVKTARVPEPATVLLLSAGLIGLAGFSRRRKESKG